MRSNTSSPHHYPRSATFLLLLVVTNQQQIDGSPREVKSTFFIPAANMKSLSMISHRALWRRRESLQQPYQKAGRYTEGRQIEVGHAQGSVTKVYQVAPGELTYYLVSRVLRYGLEALSLRAGYTPRYLDIDFSICDSVCYFLWDAPAYGGACWMENQARDEIR